MHFKKLLFVSPSWSTLLIIFILLLSGIAGLGLSLWQHTTLNSKKDLLQNNNIIQNFHHPLSFVQQLKNDPHAGKKIFKEFCSHCHGRQPEINIGAPLISDRNAWKKIGELGIDTLLKITTNGTGAMPARGGCFECSDQQLRQTILYILQGEHAKS